MKFQTLIFYGFSVFSMFFGSGNLVFPIKIGMKAGDHWIFGFLGLFITAIILPFLGLFVIKLYDGEPKKFFAQAGSLAQIFLPFFTLSLLGSFGVVPRCITVAAGSLTYILPSLDLNYLNLIFCIICFALALNTNFMLTILGKILTPILLIFLSILIIYGIIITQDSLDTPNNTGIFDSFNNGFLTGYETMDLFAAFFFSALIFKQIQQEVKITSLDSAALLKIALKPSIIGAILLCIVYIGFVFLGSRYSVALQNIEPTMLLPALAHKILGKNASSIITVIVCLSCLTTAVALSNIYANYLITQFRLPKKFFPFIIFGVLAIAYYVSLTNFTNISNFLAPVLEISYPGLIALTILSIITRNHHLLKIFIFYLIIFIQIIM